MPWLLPQSKIGRTCQMTAKRMIQIKIKNNSHIGKALALPWRGMDFRSLATDDGFGGRKNIIQDSKTLCCQNVSLYLALENIEFGPFKFVTNWYVERWNDFLKFPRLVKAGLDEYPNHLLSGPAVSYCFVLPLACFQHTEDPLISDC